MVPRDDRPSRFSWAEVGRLMRNAGGYEQEVEVSRRADDFVFKGGPPARADLSFEHIDSRLVADVDMRLGTGARWDNDQMHGQPGGMDGLTGDANEIGKALPGHDLAVWPQALDFGMLVFHGSDLYWMALGWWADNRRKPCGVWMWATRRATDPATTDTGASISRDCNKLARRSGSG